MVIFTTLKADHKKLKGYLKKIKAELKAEKKPAATFGSFVTLLKAHAPAEEKALYERMKAAGGKAKDLGLEGKEEHHVADILVAELSSLSMNDEAWAAKFEVLSEALEHHIEEEEKDMFKAARAKISKAELEAADREFKQLKKQKPLKGFQGYLVPKHEHQDSYKTQLIA